MSRPKANPPVAFGAPPFSKGIFNAVDDSPDFSGFLRPQPLLPPPSKKGD